MTAPKRRAGEFKDDRGNYRPPDFGNFGMYMGQKKQKLREQDDLRAPSLSGASGSGRAPPQIFHGMTLHINGYCDEMPLQELKALILKHGGQYDHYFSKSTTTHMVASNLTPAKKHEFRHFKVATPRWVLDSIAQGKLLPWHQYSALTMAPSVSGQALLVPTVHGATSSGPIHHPQPGHASLQSPAPAVPVQPSTPARPLAPAPAARLAAKDAKDPEFLQQYYQNSRLHFLSTWKAELQAMTRPIHEELQRKAQGRAANAPPPPFKVIMHVDMDCFFVSVALLSRPDLVDKPVGVAHAEKMNADGSSEIASCNYVARGFGVRNGMFTGQARKLCPQLVLLPYDFAAYRATTAQLYNVLRDFATGLHAVSCDEAYIDVSPRITDPAEILPLAHTIRAEIRAQTRCAASIGCGENMLLARLATARAKPDGAVAWTRDEFMKALPEIKIRDLPGVGHHVARKLAEMKAVTAADLAKVSKAKLQAELGAKLGETLYAYCRGIDERDFGHKPRQTVSAEVNYGIRFDTQDQAHEFMRQLTREVAQRLHSVGAKAAHMTLKIMKRATDADPRKHLGHGICDTFSKSQTLARATDQADVLATVACALLDAFAFAPADLRGIGISCTRLVYPGDTVEKGSRTLFDFVRPTKGKKEEKGNVAGEGGGDAIGRRQDPAPPPRPPARFEDVARADGPFRVESAASKMSAQVDEIMAQELDLSVLNELPPDIRREVIQDKRQEIESRLRRGRHQPPARAPARRAPSPPRRQAPAKPTVRSPPAPPAAAPPADGPPGQPPALLNCRALPAVRRLLLQWLEHSAANVATTDFATDGAMVGDYVERLVDAKYYDVAQRVLQYMSYLLQTRKDTWPAPVAGMVHAVLDRGAEAVRRAVGEEAILAL
ncbi:deoxycytidyl transferase [Allomyces arbusculus]|nr:deoxycytidyl transferase [Allomyces arbusculus]